MTGSLVVLLLAEQRRGWSLMIFSDARIADQKVPSARRRAVEPTRVPFLGKETSKLGRTIGWCSFDARSQRALQATL